MSKHDPDGLPKGSKWGVCEVCGYRITERDHDDMEMVDTMVFVHGRCEDDYTEVSDDE